MTPIARKLFQLLPPLIEYLNRRHGVCPRLYRLLCTCAWSVSVNTNTSFYYYL
jgi:hypothetical protein